MLKIAFFSPLNPQHSGIADYSESLLPFLTQGAEIDIFVDGFKPANTDITSQFSIFDYKNNPDHLNHLKQYDAILYHMGNDCHYHTGIYRTALKHPGIIVLHDFVLQDFFIGMTGTAEGIEVYLDELEAGAGYSERQRAKAFFEQGMLPPHFIDPVKFPLNSRLATRSDALIVHSEWSRERLQKIAPVTPVRRIPFLNNFQENVQPPALKNRNAYSERIQIASFGFITPGKGIKRVLNALAKLRDRFDFQYTLVGETNSNFDVREVIRELDLEGRVKITEYIAIEEFLQRISETDIAINLREQIIGETSSSLCRIMSAGVVSIIPDTGWYAELPDDCVVKIDMDNCTDEMLEAYLVRLMEDRNLRLRLGRNAQEYMLKNHRIEECARQYLEFIHEISANRLRRRFITSIATDIAKLTMNNQISERVIYEVAQEVSELAPRQTLNKK